MIVKPFELTAYDPLKPEGAPGATVQAPGPGTGPGGDEPPVTVTDTSFEADPVPQLFLARTRT